MTQKEQSLVVLKAIIKQRSVEDTINRNYLIEKIEGVH